MEVEKLREALERIKQEFGCDPAYYGIGEDFEYLEMAIDELDKKDDKPMTNREWLESLSDKDFVIWCIREEFVDYNTYKVEAPTPRLHNLIRQGSDGELWLLQWLKEERKK